MYNNIHREERRMKRARTFFRCASFIFLILSGWATRFLWIASENTPDIMLATGGFASALGMGAFCGYMAWLFFVELRD